MNHSLLVSVLQGVRDLPGDGQRFLERDRALRDALGQRRALRQLEHQRAVLHAIDRRDVGMVQRRQHLRFAGESRHAVGVLRERFGDDFDGHVAAQLGIGGAVHFAHAA